MKWLYVKPDDTVRGDIHVQPIQDLHEHEQSRACWCAPRCEKEPWWAYTLVIHNSMDGRELVEEHGLQ